MPDWPYIAMFAPWLPAIAAVWWERRKESRQREALSVQPPDGLLLKGKGSYRIVTDDDIDELSVNLPDGAKVELDCKGTIGGLNVLNGGVALGDAGGPIVTDLRVVGGVLDIHGNLDVHEMTEMGDTERKYIFPFGPSGRFSADEATALAEQARAQKPALPAKDMKCVVLDGRMDIQNVPNDVVVLKYKRNLTGPDMERIRREWERQHRGEAERAPPPKRIQRHLPLPLALYREGILTQNEMREQMGDGKANWHGNKWQ